MSSKLRSHFTLTMFSNVRYRKAGSPYFLAVRDLIALVVQFSKNPYLHEQAIKISTVFPLISNFRAIITNNT